MADIIEHDLQAMKSTEEPESAVLQYALMESFELAMRHSCDGARFFDHANLERDLAVQYDYLLRCEEPRLIQLFRGWHIFYKQKVHVYDSFLRALSAWFYLMYRDYGGRLSKRITLDELAEEIFGPELHCRVLLRKEPPPKLVARSAYCS